jgi:hypothetical protein
VSEELQGWHPDPFGRHEWRYFSAGRATFLVRDGRVEGSDPVEQIPQQPYPPSIVSGISEPAPVPASVVPPTKPAQERAAPPSERHSAAEHSAPGRVASGHAASRRRVPGHRSRTAMLAAIAVVLVVVVVAVAATSHKPRSTAGPSSITSPTAVSSASAAATYSAAAAGARVASTSGHFAARFPSEPIQQSFEETIAGVHASILVAAVRSPLTEVAEEDLSSAVSRSQQALALRSAIAVAAATVADGASARQSDTTFRGKAARTSTFATSTGEQITAIAFFQDDRTVYFLLANAGVPIQALSESLQFGSPSSPSVLS